MQILVKVDLESDGGRYLVSCARIRNIGMPVLLRRLVDVIAQDQMVLSILDDDSKRTQRSKSERRFKEVA